MRSQINNLRSSVIVIFASNKFTVLIKKIPWPVARKRIKPTELPPLLVSKSAPTFADKKRYVVSATDPHGR
jgi:hypothetical protein